MISHWKEITDFSEQVAGSLDGAPLGPRIKEASRMLNGLMMEVAELQESWSWKITRDHRRNEEPWVDRENVKREIIDCLFFLRHIAGCFGIDDVDLEAKFNEVLANNRRRHIDGDLSEEGDSESQETEELLKQMSIISSQLDILIEGAKK